MKRLLQQLALALLTSVAAMTADARPIALPNPATPSQQTGTFSVNADNQITLTGNPISLSTSLPSQGDIASGSTGFKEGSLQYNDGTTKVDGRMSRVVFGNEIKNGQVIYRLKGLVYGELTQAGTTVDVNGDFFVSTLPAPEGTELAQAQVNFSQLLLTIRSQFSPNAKPHQRK